MVTQALTAGSGDSASAAGASVDETTVSTAGAGGDAAFSAAAADRENAAGASDGACPIAFNLHFHIVDLNKCEQKRSEKLPHGHAPKGGSSGSQGKSARCV